MYFLLGIRFICVWLLFISTGNLSYCQNDLRVKAICTYSKSTTLNLHCSNYSLILIKHAFFGKSVVDKCHHSENDCYLIDFTNNNVCNRKSFCQFIIQPTILQKCSHPNSTQSNNVLSDYYQIVYECINKKTILNMCQTVETSSQNGLIVSPNLDNLSANYQENKTVICQLIIDLTRHPYSDNKITQNIIVVILDMKLDCMTSYLQLSDYSGKSWKSCKLTRQSHVFTSITSKLIVKYQFNPFIMEENRGFWLSYKASPYIVYPDENYIKNVCNKLQSATKKSMKDNKFIQNHIYSLEKDKSMKKLIEVSNINHVIMLSVFIGILSLLLTVLSSVVLVKRYKMCLKKSDGDAVNRSVTQRRNYINLEQPIHILSDPTHSATLNCRSFQCQNQSCIHERSSLLKNLSEDVKHCSICSNYLNWRSENIPHQQILITHSAQIQNACDV